MIIHADVCADEYRTLADGADVQIVDPPYSAKVHASATSAGTGGAGARKRDLGFAHCSPELMARIAEYAAQVRRWTVVFSDRESAHLWRAAMAARGVEYIRDIPWIRWSQPQLSGDRPPTGAESVLVFHRGGGVKRSGAVVPVRKRWSGPGGRIMYSEKSLRGADKYSCEKPLDLMLAIVSDFSDPGEVVLDPCCGSGTTVRAAELLGRVGYGVDASAAAHALATARLAADLSKREAERAARWAAETAVEASSIGKPKGTHDVRTYERAQRRLADARMCEERVGTVDEKWCGR